MANRDQRSPGGGGAGHGRGTPLPPRYPRRRGEVSDSKLKVAGEKAQGRALPSRPRPTSGTGDSHPDTLANSDARPKPDGNSHGNPNPEADGNSNGDADSDPEADGNSNGDADSDPEADSNSCTNADHCSHTHAFAYGEAQPVHAGRAWRPGTPHPQNRPPEGRQHIQGTLGRNFLRPDQTLPQATSGSS